MSATKQQVSTGEPIIVLREVSKSYGAVKIISRLNLEIPRFQKVSLIGPSGSGKSTLLRMLMTLEKIDSGDVIIEGESIWTPTLNGAKLPADRAHLRRIRSKVGMVFQSFNLFPHMTVLRNIMEAPIHVRGLSREESEQQAMELLKKIGMETKRDAHPAQLSGGQKQRVAIARALAMRPKIMLFDEITSALDPELVGEVLGVLRDLAHNREMTLLMVTHHMHFAREISDRVIFIDHGQVVEDNSPEVIFEKPAHERTKNFLRSIFDL